MKYRITAESKRLLIVLVIAFLLSAAVAVLADLIVWRWGGIITALSTMLIIIIILNFYRDPERMSKEPKHFILAPADGRIVRVEKIAEDWHLKRTAWHIAIFMHVGNVHIQRMPSDGRLMKTEHRKGKYRAVLDPKAPIENEQQWYGFKSDYGAYTVVQIAGLLARRIISWIKEGDLLARGDRFGMIALGSEVDLYLPLEVGIIAKEGMLVKAGETVLARWHQ